MKTYFTSDLHFAHKRICEFTKRGAETTQEGHDEWLIQLWNATVKPEDTVVHIGDFCMQWELDVMVNLLNRLNGSKIFLVGNHDQKELLQHIMDCYASTRLKRVEDMAYEKVCGVWTHMYHYPIGSWRNMSHGSWHLHGHSHGNYRNGHEGRILDVGIDNSYKMYGKHFLFSGEMVKAHMLSREVSVNDSHRKPYGGQRTPPTSDGAPIHKT